MNKPSEMTAPSPRCVELPTPCWVRVMADYSASGVWNSLGESMDADKLPVSAAWLDRLQAWCDWYEDNDDYLPAVARKRPLFPIAEFCAEGRALAQALKAELGADWTVVYFDEVAASQAGPDSPRDTYEYPV